MKNREYLKGIVLILLTVVPAATAAQDDEGRPISGPPAPNEMQVLAARVGNWTTEFVVKPARGAAEGLTGVGEYTGRTIHNGHFLLIAGFSTSTQGRNEYTSLYSYAPSRNGYRWWYFSSAGIAAEYAGTWDETTKTMTWQGVGGPADQTWLIKDHFADNRVTATVLGEARDGTVLLDADYVAVRNKQPTAKRDDAPVFNGPPVQEELKVLTPLVGQWTTAVTAKPSLRHPQGFTGEGQISCQWMHNGHFVRVDGASGRFGSTEIIGYDRSVKAISPFCFHNRGHCGRERGQLGRQDPGHDLAGGESSGRLDCRGQDEPGKGTGGHFFAGEE